MEIIQENPLQIIEKPKRIKKEKIILKCIKCDKIIK